MNNVTIYAIDRQTVTVTRFIIFFVCFMLHCSCTSHKLVTIIALCVPFRPLLILCVSILFLAKRDYVTFGYMLWQIRLSVVCDVRAPYSGDLTLRGYFCTIVAWPSGNSPTKNHEDHPRGSPPTGALNARGVGKVAIFDQYLAIARKRLEIDGYMLRCFDQH